MSSRGRGGSKSHSHKNNNNNRGSFSSSSSSSRGGSSSRGRGGRQTFSANAGFVPLDKFGNGGSTNPFDRIQLRQKHQVIQQQRTPNTYMYVCL